MIENQHMRPLSYTVIEKAGYIQQHTRLNSPSNQFYHIEFSKREEKFTEEIK